jgi:hypothetical protein
MNIVDLHVLCIAQVFRERTLFLKIEIDKAPTDFSGQ